MPDAGFCAESGAANASAPMATSAQTLVRLTDRLILGVVTAGWHGHQPLERLVFVLPRRFRGRTLDGMERLPLTTSLHSRSTAAFKSRPERRIRVAGSRAGSETLVLAPPAVRLTPLGVSSGSKDIQRAAAQARRSHQAPA